MYIKRLDFALLTTSKSHPNFSLFLGRAAELQNRHLALCTYQLGLQECLEEFDLQLTTMTVRPPPPPLHDHSSLV